MIDLIQTPEGDIEISTGDILYGESTGGHQRDILLSDKGHYKESPETGVGAVNFINSEDPEDFLRCVRREFSRDGMKVEGMELINGRLEVEAAYETDNG